MSSEATIGYGENTEHPAVNMTSTGADIAVLIELPRGEAALIPAERQGKVVTPIQEQAILSGSTAPGSRFWRDLRDSGWRWVQDGAFGQKYWRRDSVENAAPKKKPGRR